MVHHPAITGPSEVLGGIEAEAARISDSSGTLSAHFGANGLRRIFNYRQLVPGRYTEHSFHIGHLAEKMHWKDGSGPRCYSRFNACRDRY